MINITITPADRSIRVKKGTNLQDVLFPFGIEFPCGGKGTCRRCKIRILDGATEPDAFSKEIFTEKQLNDGWRLACKTEPQNDITIEIAQWESGVLTDNTEFSFIPTNGIGVAVDVGTTTIAAQLVNLNDGRILSVATSLNPQARFGGDLMSRIDAAVTGGKSEELTSILRKTIEKLINSLIKDSKHEKSEITKVVLTGNTAMHHFFSGLDMTPLAYYPFETTKNGLINLSPKDINFDLSEKCNIYFLPSLGGFVGSDLLAGIFSLEMEKGESKRLLIDLGTNGEIILNDGKKLYAASTAAGPAFEGAGIDMGMRADSGAIWKVQIIDDKMKSKTVSNTPAKGICGSGLIDAIAIGLDKGVILPSGRLKENQDFVIHNPVKLIGLDIRQVQLAKGAIAAGIEILLQKAGITIDDIEEVYLAGAFGNYIDKTSAVRIGMLKFPLEKIITSGNTSLLGAKMALFMKEDKLHFSEITERTTHISLAADMNFQNIYAEEMTF